MARLLESLEPLLALVLATPDPATTAAALLTDVGSGDSANLLALLGSSDLSVAALRFAGVVLPSGQLSLDARDQLIRLETLLAARKDDKDGWRLVVTAPPYFRKSVPSEILLETLPSLISIVSSARRRLIIASPFLDTGFLGLAPFISRLLAAGGQVVLLTRQLADPTSQNSVAVRELRKSCVDARRLEVASWEDDGLGLHLKAIVVDSQHAYVGSANLTRAGMGQHAELGVLLEGPSVREIERLLDGLADALKLRRRLQSR